VFVLAENHVARQDRKTNGRDANFSRLRSGPQSNTLGAFKAHTQVLFLPADAIGTISTVIHQINDISGTIATAVEEQSATTNEMTRNVADAAKGSGDITQNISGVASAAQGTSSSAQESQKAATDLADMAEQLRSLVEQFKISSDHSGVADAATPKTVRSFAAAAGR
jgi:hypothetical protein